MLDIPDNKDNKIKDVILTLVIIVTKKKSP
jgi:hypothetical protein